MIMTATITTTITEMDMIKGIEADTETDIDHDHIRESRKIATAVTLRPLCSERDVLGSNGYLLREYAHRQLQDQSNYQKLAFF